MIMYKRNLDTISIDMLTDQFFEGWPKKPSPRTHYSLLKNSHFITLAVDGETNTVIGFITAISDKVLSAYIPFLEVLPTHRKLGIGTQLVQDMLDQLKDLYMVDLICDHELSSFYKPLGFIECQGMVKRNYAMQSGKCSLNNKGDH